MLLFTRLNTVCVCVYVFVLVRQAKSILSDPHELFLNKIKWTPRA